MVQQVRICLSIDLGAILGRKIQNATEQLSPCATTAWPALWSWGVTTSESVHLGLCSATREATAMRVALACHIKRKPVCSNEDPMLPKTNK